VADPEPYKGERSNFKNFVTQLSLKFSSNPAVFTSESAKIIYASSYLRGAAYTWIAPKIDATSGTLPYLTYGEFLEDLQASFDDPDSYATSERALQSLKQEGSCANYYTQFISLISKLCWSDSPPIISMFKAGLKDSVKDALVTQRPPMDSLANFAKHCIELDNAHYSRQLEKKAIPGNTKAKPPVKHSSLNQTPQSSHPPAATTPPTQSMGEPMQLDSAQKAKNKAERLAKGLCLYCGKAGHYANKCPNKKSRPQVNQARTQPETHHVAHIAPARVKYEPNNIIKLKWPEPYPQQKLNCAQALALAFPANHAPLMVVASLLNKTIPAIAMVDSGASSTFIDEDFIKTHNLKTTKKAVPETLNLVDGNETSSGKITQEITLEMEIDAHLETVTFQVTKLADYPVILGKTWLNHHDPSISWSKNELKFTSPKCATHCAPVPLTIQSIQIKDYEDKLKQSIPGIFADELAQLKKIIPAKYHYLLSLFSKCQADKLPPHRYIDHMIQLEEGTKPPFGPLYSMSDLELDSLSEYLKENLDKGFIRPSSSSAASPVLFVKKPGGGLRLCVDYRALNAITKKNRYPLPLINDSLRRLSRAKIFTRLDLRAAYNLIRIYPGDEWKTAFRTRYGLYEYLVMPFGLTNAPATMQQYVNDVMREFLDIFVIVYLDDILIFSEEVSLHETHVKKVLEELAKAGLFVKGEKCEFDTQTTTFVGFVISPTGISMDPKKVETVKEWETPKNVRELQSFLGFANFYRRFIKDYSRMAKPLFALLKKGVKFHWTESQQTAFECLKELFCTEPILRHFDPSLDSVLETDASDTAVSAILSQWTENSDGKLLLHPVAYYSRSMTSAECNYGIGDKELLAIVEGMREYHCMVVSLKKPIQIITDHANLLTIATKQILNRRQARWALELSEIPFTMSHRPGVDNKRADALTRRSSDKSQVTSSPQLIIQPHKLKLSCLQPADFLSSQTKDPWAMGVLKALKEKAPKHPDIDLASCSCDHDNLVTVNGLIYVPPDLRVKIIKSRHDHPAAGHPGQAATFELITRDFWWPKLRKDISQFIRNCETCHRIKPVRHAPYGLLKPLSVPQRRWESVSMDFIVGLPSSGTSSSDCILVVVDRLTKMAHFIPCLSTLDAPGFASLFRDNIFRLHGLPDSVISDRDSLFTSDFSRALASVLKIKQRMSTSFHPQTDGQTERVNAILEQYLRAYCNYQQDNWVELLSFAEFAYNNSISATTKVSPFFANYGYHPRYEIPANSDQASAPADLEAFMKPLKSLESHLKNEILWAQDAMSEQANKHHTPAPVYKEGDLAWLLRRNVKTTRPSGKLDFKKLGPFKVLAKISSHAYKLDLPSSMKIHPVFHVSLLEPVAQDPLPDQVNPPPLPIIVEGEEEYFIEEILDVKAKGPLKYLVKWAGYSLPTWELYENVKDCAALDKFYQSYPKKRKHP
jgi:hypothetical protein